MITVTEFQLSMAKVLPLKILNFTMLPGRECQEQSPYSAVRNLQFIHDIFDGCGDEFSIIYYTPYLKLDHKLFNIETSNNPPVIFVFSNSLLEADAQKFGWTAQRLLNRADMSACDRGLPRLFFVATTNARPDAKLESLLIKQGFSAFPGLGCMNRF